MPQTNSSGSLEQKQLQEKAWIFAQHGVVLLVALLAGVFIGHHLWGRTGDLNQKVVQLEERVNFLQKERDTLNTKTAISERDKKEVEKRLQDVQARCAVPAEAAPAARP